MLILSVMCLGKETISTMINTVPTGAAKVFTIAANTWIIYQGENLHRYDTPTVKLPTARTVSFDKIFLHVLTF